MNQKIAHLLSLGKIPLKSQGQSMLPILHENDIVYFKKISFSSIKLMPYKLVQPPIKGLKLKVI